MAKDPNKMTSSEYRAWRESQEAAQKGEATDDSGRSADDERNAWFLRHWLGKPPEHLFGQKFGAPWTKQ